MRSETTLWEVLRRTRALKPYIDGAPLFLSAGDGESFFYHIRDKILFAAKRFAKEAIKNVELFGGVGIYREIGDKTWKRSAAVAELFRRCGIAINAGYLDVRSFQEIVHDAVTACPRITFELGWGQAKRDAGLLKAAGPNADLAELVAISRLAAITSAVQLIMEHPVVVRIVTGGFRFRPALFVDHAKDSNYNDQREKVSTTLGVGEILLFDTGHVYWSESELKSELKARMADDEVCAASEMESRFVLFNLDWYRILDETLAPHGLSPPEPLIDAWKLASISVQQLILRHLLAGVANPSLDLGQVAQIMEPDALRIASAWAMDVARISALKYRLLGEITNRQLHVNRGSGIILLTVIEKNDKPMIPALTLLGKSNGCLLPQHVVAMLTRGRTLEFLPYYCAPGSVRRVQFDEVCDFPLFVTPLAAEEVRPMLLKTEIFADDEFA